MKIMKELHNNAAVEVVPFGSGGENNNKNKPPNEMMYILENLYKLKTSFETSQWERKCHAAAILGKKDREAAKVIPRAPIGELCAARQASVSPPSDSTVTDGSEWDDDDDVDTDVSSGCSGSNKKKQAEPSSSSGGGEAAVAAVEVMAKAFLAEMREEKKKVVDNRAYKRQRLAVQLEKDRQQIALNEMQLVKDRQQIVLNATMIDMMKTISENMKRN